MATRIINDFEYEVITLAELVDRAQGYYGDLPRTDVITGEILTDDDMLVVPWNNARWKGTALENIENDTSGRYVACECCHRFIDTENDDYTEFDDGGYVCPNCVGDCCDDYYTCDHCGEVFRVSDMPVYYVRDRYGDELPVCEDCIDEYSCCGCCDEYCEDDILHTVYDRYGNYDTEMCGDCLSRGDYTWIESGDGFPEGYYHDCDLTCVNDSYDAPIGWVEDNCLYCDYNDWWFDDDGLARLDDCIGCTYDCPHARNADNAEASVRESDNRVTDRVWDGVYRIHGYHNHPRGCFLKFGKGGVVMNDHDLANPENTHMIGTELEIERATPNAIPHELMAQLIAELLGDHCYFETDCSLRDGFEIIFNPHTPEAFWELPWKELLQMINDNGYQSHDSGRCGLHIHTSCEWYGDTDEEVQANVAKVLYMYSADWDFLLKCSRRRTTGYCERRTFVSYEAAMTDFQYATGHGSCLNIDSMISWYDSSYQFYCRPGDSTLEFRLGRGTLKFESFSAWIDMHLAIIRNVKNIEAGDTDIANWFKGVSYDTARFIFQKTGIWVATSAKKERRA